MKSIKIAVCVTALFLSSSCGNMGQILSTTNEVLKTMSTGITEEEAGSGLKEALTNGIGAGVDLLGAQDGFLKNNLYKIVFPPEALKVESKLRELGFGANCDKVIANINRGAEMAALEAKPIFVAAIKNLSFTQAIKIVTGGEGAATQYLKNTTKDALLAKFQPIIQASLDKSEATKYWTDIVTLYNKIPLVEKVNPDLNKYVTDKAMFALFSQVEYQENLIRKDPLKRTSDLLKKVFSYADSQKSGN